MRKVFEVLGEDCNISAEFSEGFVLMTVENHEASINAGTGEVTKNSSVVEFYPTVEEVKALIKGLEMLIEGENK